MNYADLLVFQPTGILTSSLYVVILEYNYELDNGTLGTLTGSSVFMGTTNTSMITNTNETTIYLNDQYVLEYYQNDQLLSSEKNNIIDLTADFDIVKVIGDGTIASLEKNNFISEDEVIGDSFVTKTKIDGIYSIDANIVNENDIVVVEEINANLFQKLFGLNKKSYTAETIKSLKIPANEIDNYNFYMEVSK